MMRSFRHFRRWEKVSYLEEAEMAWTAPKIKDIACGMEINMYQPGEDEERGHDHEPI